MIPIQAIESPSQSTFYPTPKALADKMLSDIEFFAVETILEPSAGKGDLADALCSKPYTNSKKIDCVEIDPNLRAILKSKGYRVVHDDFLTMATFKKYDLIVMNPPFDHGAEHLLKAMDMQRKHGGAVICLLNAETLRNPHGHKRSVLLRELEESGAHIEYLQNAFANAERKTDVEIALVKVHYPKPEKNSFILDGLRKAKTFDAEEPEVPSALIGGNFAERIVQAYNFEVAAGIGLIQEYTAISPYLRKSISPDYHSFPMLNLIMQEGRHEEDADINRYVRATRRKYWEELFCNDKFTQNLTEKLKGELRGKLDDLEHYDFSEYNILQLQADMNRQVITGIEDAIIKLFDDWTHRYHYSEQSQNRHYFDGWKTNDCFKVSKKVIFPMYGIWDNWSGKYRPSSYERVRAVADIVKVFDYLSGKAPDEEGIKETLKAAEADGQSKNIPFRHFTVTFYKKGTAHITFTDQRVLEKFNLYAARKKEWLPPSYGRKRYDDMDSEERAVIDSFEGREHYEAVMRQADYFLSAPETLQIGDGTL